MDLVERVQLTLSTVISLAVTLFFLTAVYQGQWFNAFLALLYIILSYIPAVVERNYKITLPVEIEFVVVVFLFLAIYLGSIRGYYEYYWWWDIFLHTFSGIILGMIGFIIVFIIREESRLRLSISPLFVGIFTFLFAVTLGTLWEIFEFIVDQLALVSSPMQVDNFDTMEDLIDDAFGALFVSIAGFLYCRKVRIPLLHRVMSKLVEKNPGIFKRMKSNSRNFLRRRLERIRRVKFTTLKRVDTILRQLRKISGKK